MRYIDLRKVQEKLPAGWIEKAETALQEIRSLAPNQRAGAINSKSQIWQDLKDTLKKVSHDKCWYCETIQERSDNAVDHFRPKNRVAECVDHEGYWWLAFSWSNYRFSCTFCNSKRIEREYGTAGGKQDHFPLLDETKRARCPEDCLEDEQSLLLDPTRSADPLLLWFDEDGSVVPNPAICGSKDSYFWKRVKESTKLFHLDHIAVTEHRKQLARKIKEKASQANGFCVKSSKGDVTAGVSFDNCITDLRSMLKPESEYSAAARAILMGLRGTFPFVDAILQTN